MSAEQENAILQLLAFQRRLRSVADPPPPPDPFGRRPVDSRAVKEAIIRSHASAPSNRDLRRAGRR